jgi:hypothetical protein
MTVAYLNDEVVVKEAQRRLQAYLPIDWEGNWYNAMDAWMALIGAAGMSTSIAAVCREGQEAPSDNTLREKLDEQGWDDRIIETACNDILAQSVRQCSWHGQFPVIIDLHEEPFYGKVPQDDPDVIRRGQAKAGTTSFHTFATAYVSRHHRRFTLALTRVRAHESMLDVADRLRKRVEALGIDVQVYLLDRQFWTYELQVATMVEHQFSLLFDQLEQRWPVASVRLVHRTGRVPAGEPSLWVEVVAPHRGEAFAACQWLIDEMKRVVPIWKHPVAANS